MGHQIIQAPDGTLAVFSSNSGTWMLYNLSPEALLDYYVEKAAEEARQRTQRVLDLVLACKPREVYYQFTMTFGEATAKSKYRGGEVLDGPLDEALLTELYSLGE